MSKIYIIDDEYIKENYPSVSTLSNKDLLSVIMIEQRSTLVDTLSYETYNSLLINIRDGEINGEWVELLRLTQEYLLFISVKSIYDLYMGKTDGNSRDFNVSNLYGKIEFSKRNIKKFLSISSIETGEEYSSSYYNGSPIYYPN